MANPHVPKFGNWDSGENVPYTEYFDNARKGRTGGRITNPNDPQQNPDAFSEDVPPVQAPPFRTGQEGPPSRPKDERRLSKEESDSKQSMDPPLRHQKKDRRMSDGSERSLEQSPLHPHLQAKSGSRGGVSSPSWERKGSNEGGHGYGSSTPGRSRLRPRGDETPDRGAAVPKFGDWDETNPSSADGYTHIFNKVREEKQSGSAKVPIITTDPPLYNGHKHDNRQRDSSSCCCFGGWRKN
ncbi:RPM1-interacting protein 4 [Acorus gramineus]|uniref:RPM1-interacting protein 4 n=1 Tax=Acorus gramineus TaxID=55184 RepID=A0AAV9A648_ACOGR|nr:RPM1-interacting protein 4 [Acorus gramineus]